MCKRNITAWDGLSTHMDAEDVGILEAVVRVWYGNSLYSTDG